MSCHVCRCTAIVRVVSFNRLSYRYFFNTISRSKCGWIYCHVFDCATCSIPVVRIGICQGTATIDVVLDDTTGDVDGNATLDGT